ncbi:BRO-N domain-containing protein [Xylella fastidiosa]|uniref:BRO-N domain-containing protein n=1 Tax=Xylella fastidiosa TaxID=2371 RepID=UPI0007660CEF|nr:BRO family protein [Xylella fastidiosa]ALR01541.1 hypothetical protein OY18_04035 [Xylella fastidiosa]KXB14673.1 hypothetical protein ADT29_05800 [Xylella fastidiosa]KXB18740.1 hypothetical protein ADT28_12595 [Xylella fastidiosa]MDG5825424.1 BRO family protein [Xylella fastidiosa subsp. pauca]NRP56058.1 hypothetical protein [Xylella fastidiosa]
MSQSIIPFDFHSHAVRVVMRDGNPWFVATDVMGALDYAATSNPARVTEHIPSEWKGVNPIHTLGGEQKLLCLAEPGLYFFLGRSDKPKALPFQKWLAGEVLPSIRKTGSYSASHSPAVTLTEVEAFRLYALLRMVAGHLSRERIEPIEQALRLMHSPLAGAVSDLWREVGPRAKRMENLAGRCRSALYRLR